MALSPLSMNAPDCNAGPKCSVARHHRSDRWIAGRPEGRQRRARAIEIERGYLLGQRGLERIGRGLRAQALAEVERARIPARQQAIELVEIKRSLVALNGRRLGARSGMLTQARTKVAQHGRRKHIECAQHRLPICTCLRTGMRA